MGSTVSGYTKVPESKDLKDVKSEPKKGTIKDVPALDSKKDVKTELQDVVYFTYTDDDGEKVIQVNTSVMKSIYLTHLMVREKLNELDDNGDLISKDKGTIFYTFKHGKETIIESIRTLIEIGKVYVRAKKYTKLRVVRLHNAISEIDILYEYDISHIGEMVRAFYKAHNIHYPSSAYLFFKCNARNKLLIDTTAKLAEQKDVYVCSVTPIERKVKLFEEKTVSIVASPYSSNSELRDIIHATIGIPSYYNIDFDQSLSDIKLLPNSIKICLENSEKHFYVSANDKQFQKSLKRIDTLYNEIYELYRAYKVHFSTTKRLVVKYNGVVITKRNIAKLQKLHYIRENDVMVASLYISFMDCIQLSVQYTPKQAPKFNADRISFTALNNLDVLPKTPSTDSLTFTMNIHPFSSYEIVTGILISNLTRNRVYVGLQNLRLYYFVNGSKYMLGNEIEDGNDCVQNTVIYVDEV